ncbi:MAG: hypothetical protein ACRDM7_21840, partial [Thermoleophilaceae bacterium]
MRSCPFGCGFTLGERTHDDEGRRIPRQVMEQSWLAVLEHHRRDGRCAPPRRGARPSWWRRLLRLR